MMSLFSKEKNIKNKKMIENLVLFLILFIIVIIVINSIGEGTSNSIQSNNDLSYVVNQNNKKSEETLEEKVENILSLIDGVGKVNVLITYATGLEEVPMYNTKQDTTTIQETDKDGGIRKTEEVNSEKSIIFNENGNIKTPVIKQTINPKIIGVVVVAEGAENPGIKENLIKATESILDVSSHRVQVFSRKK